jgi:uncharacterized membrane protein
MDDPNLRQDYVQYPRGGSYHGPPRVRVEAIGEAFSLLLRDLVTWLATSLLLLFIILLIEVPYGYKALALAFENSGVTGMRKQQAEMLPYLLATTFAYTFVLGVLNAGVLRMAVLKVRRQEASIGDMFRLSGKTGSIVLAELILAPLPLLVGGASSIAMWINGPKGDLMAASALGIVLQVVFAILVGVAQVFFTFVPMLIVDKAMTTKEAFKTSFETARKHFWSLFALLFIAVIVQYAGMIAICIGILFTMPLFYLIRAIIYNDLFGPRLVDFPAGTGERETPPSYSSL